MSKLLKRIILLALPAVLLSCTCTTPLRVTEIQKTDKKLTCKDVILEINQSEHYRDLAKREEGIGFGEALMPVCWITSFIDAKKAKDAAQTRIEYLGHIYDVLDCGGKSDIGDKSEKAPPPVAPPFIQVQPVPAPTPAPAPKVEPAPEEPYIKGEADVDDDLIKKNMHQHTDKFGRVYTHSHFHTGPHRHIDD